jgi:hypothetical protein
MEGTNAGHLQQGITRGTEVTANIAPYLSRYKAKGGF